MRRPAKPHRGDSAPAQRIALGLADKTCKPCKGGSIPGVDFGENDPMPPQKSPPFFLERFHPVMIRLVRNIASASPFAPSLDRQARPSLDSLGIVPLSAPAFCRVQHRENFGRRMDRRLVFLNPCSDFPHLLHRQMLNGGLDFSKDVGPLGHKGAGMRDPLGSLTNFGLRPRTDLRRDAAASI